MFFLILFGVCVVSHAFLLDGNIPTPTDDTSLSDKRYNNLMDLLIEERNSRKKLEEAVTRELLALKEEVATCKCGNTNSTTETPQTNNNVVESNETATIKEDFVNLQHDYNILKVQFTELVRRVEHDSLSIKFQSNETKHLEGELQVTNNRLNSVTNDVNARKQDFIALFNIVKGTEQLLENKTKTLELSQNVTASGFQKQFLTLSKEVSTTGKRLENNTKLLEVSQNLTVSRIRQEILAELRENDKKIEANQTKVQQELDKMTNRVAVTACKTGAVNNVFMFTNVKTVIGVKNLTSIQTSGIFTCETPGTYLISVFMLTPTNYGVFYVAKNGNSIADGISSMTDDKYQTTSVTLIQHLDLHDRISVTGSLSVNSGYGSCITLVQIQ